MRTLGGLLIAGGLVWLGIVSQMDTSVAVPGGGAYGLPDRVQNLSLMEQKRTHLMLSIGCVVVGTLLIGFGQIRRRDDDDWEENEGDYRQCPFCAEEVRAEAVICKHCRSELPAVAKEADEPEEGLALPDEDEAEGQVYSYRELRQAAEAAEQTQQTS
jgi:hypothetical protein